MPRFKIILSQQTFYSKEALTNSLDFDFLGKGGMPNEASVNDDVAAPSAALDVTGSKDKSDGED